MNSCSVGLYLDSECHKLIYCRTVGLKNLESFESNELELVFWRSGLTMLNINATICHHHEQTVLKKFSSFQKSCFDPFRIHKKVVKGMVLYLSTFSPTYSIENECLSCGY